ncbi:DUF4437 domain-containing protein [Nocardioides sp. zg-536]|uniref:DUF4437 domain-containing protein n=1 Tax=Nocardioides faecalis TaxID=2803858 RepID=A0A938Y848_9ACTN|nr:DUF4437 domain-containing protein [Nocardioides faecalis]MBM9459246.1 DUF4437 domain-containing protein [Nocardioides faecalis]MBS4751485.1 DUF4437 domain-containing protein [Nocardioides faecalis]QVI59620.1 DUF4437 domain-containing protein [Nocardioides faecalis]
MRPHVEMIHEQDYVWHPAELPGGVGEAVEKRLSVDEEDGSSSLLLEFVTDFSRPAGVPEADTEFFVLSGSMTYGDRVMGEWEYLHVPAGVPMAEMRVAAGTRLLHWREYGTSRFTVGGARTPQARGEVTLTDPREVEWRSTLEFVAGPLSPLYIKMLHHDPETGFYTRLIKAPVGWSEPRMLHHPVYEEFYTLAGRTASLHGDAGVGTYTFRPSHIKHGHFETLEETIWIIRCDGALENLHTVDSWIDWGGTAVNYDPATQGPRPSTLPLRSRSAGAWDARLA